MENVLGSPKEQSKTRFRSVAYPSNTIQHCVELVTLIYKIFGNIFVSRLSISKQLEISDSHLQTQLSSCVQYGLLELKSNEGYKPTPLFTKIYKPLPNEKPEDAFSLAFRNPELYKNVIKDQNNQMLTATGLSVILFRNHKVSDNASALAAKIFVDNAKFLGLIDNENLFSIDNTPTIIEGNDTSDGNDLKGKQEQNKLEDKTHTEVIYLPPSDTPPNQNNFEGGKKYNSPPIPVFVDNEGNVAEVYLPKGFNKAHIERIIKVLTAQIA